MDKEDNTEATKRDKPISLSQAILAPLDALFKAQVHGTRSFLNLILQMGYSQFGDQKRDVNSGLMDLKGKPFTIPFKTIQTDGEGNKKECTLEMPALSLVPIQPIAIESASYELALSVDYTTNHTQGQKQRYGEEKVPWYLVTQPISVRGRLTDLETDKDGEKQSGKETKQQGKINISVKVEKTPMPAGLSKLLTTLTEMAQIEENNIDGNE